MVGGKGLENTSGSPPGIEFNEKHQDFQIEKSKISISTNIISLPTYFQFHSFPIPCLEPEVETHQMNRHVQWSGEHWP